MPSDIRRIVTGLDANNKTVVLFDSRMPLAARPSGVASTNLWITDCYPPALSFTQDDPAKKPIDISPPDNGTVFRVVEFPPHDAVAEAKLEPDFLMKSIGDKAPARGVTVTHPFMHRTHHRLCGRAVRRDRHDARRHQRASQAGRHGGAAGDQSRLDQPRQGAVPHPVRPDGFEAALIW